MNFKTLLSTALLLLFATVAYGQKVILDVTYNPDYVAAQNWSVWQVISDDSALPEGFGVKLTDQDIEKGVVFVSNDKEYPVWLGGKHRMNDDFWLTYTVSGLKVGATYDIESTITLATATTCINLTAWEAGGAPAAKTVYDNQLVPTGEVFAATITATATTMTFGIGTGATNPNATNHYSRNILKNWKITENELEEYVISYYNVGSKNYDGNLASFNIGTPDVTLDTPNDSLGYSFVAWYTDISMTQAVSEPAIAQGSTGEKAFYAKWEVADLKGSVGMAGMPISGRTLTAVVADVTNNTGALSYQWQSGDNSTFSDISGATNVNYTLTDTEVGKYVRLVVESSVQSGQLACVTLRAVLSADVETYTLTYMPNEGVDGYVTSEEIPEGETPILSGNPLREGYLLTGWNMQADGNGASVTAATVLTTNTTVYAQWEIITYTVSFDVEGAYATQTTDISQGRTVTLPVAPSKAGYDFTGWNTQNDGRGDALTATTLVEQDQTVYAQWSIISYTVTFDADGTHATMATTIDSDYKVSLPEAPAKEGFVFKNWNMQADGLGATFSTEVLIDANITVYAQWREIINAIPVAINLNMKHSVDGVSDFGRERHITSHTSNTESDWEGHEEMMDYFFNDLDVYCGRDNGSSGWKNDMVTEDPNKAHWPDLASIKSVGAGLKTWYEGDDHHERHQYESRRDAMIMGLNPHGAYPSMDWTNHGKMTSGWQTYDVDAAAYFIAHYLDENFAKTPDEEGEPLPVFWECMNEPDMAVLNPSAMFLTSYEKLYEFHNLSAIEIRKVLGEYAPKIGGFTWGQHDIWGADFINRWNDAEKIYYNYSDPSIYPAYDNMWLGYDGKGTRSGGSTLFQSRKEDWWQWDALFQEFMETCAENMDFYAIHFYDWPSENDGGVTRAGGPIEATLDMIESYDIDRFGTRKDMVVSEFGTVSQVLANTLPYYRRDWENLRPFNQMFMQFLERPSHIILSMPFAPIKAIWGDWWNDDGSLSQRYASTMMDPVGEYVSPGYDHEEWEWSGMILWYELWKDVKGIRVDTKSGNPDIQVDAYVDGTHVYVILNNMELAPEYLDLNMFDVYDNQIKSVNLTHQYLDEDKDLPVNDVSTMATLPAQVKLFKSATMILDIEYADAVTIDEESKETKYVSERLSTEKNRFGRDKYYVQDLSGDLVTHVNGVDVPSIGEATLRIGLRTNNGVKANVAVNGTSILSMTSQSAELNVKGRQISRGGNGLFTMIELDVPLDLLKENNEITISVPHTTPDISSVQLQLWDMTTEPGRFDESAVIDAASLALEGESSIMEGETVALKATFTPANTSAKALEWSSSDASVISVDKYGVATANATSGSAIITATSLENGSIFATKTINAEAYQAVPVTGIEIEQGDFMTIEYFVNTPFTAKVFPENASQQTVVWSSSDDSKVSVFENKGKATGKVIGETEYIIATVTDGDKIYSDSIQVSVTVIDDGANADYTVMEEANLLVFPNPARDVVYIQGENLQGVQLYTLSGCTVFSSSANFNGSIDLSHLPSNIYLLRVNTPDGVFFDRIIHVK